MAAILHISLEPSLKNHIIGKGNFSDAMANHYLTILLYHKLLESSKDESGRTYYRTTEKGRQFIRHYKDMQGLFVHSTDSHENTPAHREVESPHGGKYATRIMIVDDESDITSAIQIGLEDNGFEANVFNDPALALESYRPGIYDLLLLDVKMPGMSGFELYRKIRDIDTKAKVCFLTAFEMYSDEFRRVFPSMNVEHFIQKPIAMTDLVQQIKRLTERP
jgi:CheY-like chemotaxis protein/predicted transcriptional regulator